MEAAAQRTGIDLLRSAMALTRYDYVATFVTTWKHGAWEGFGIYTAILTMEEA
jgi:hypothetical protein